MRWNRVAAITGDCKSPAFGLRRFESYFQHHNKYRSLWPVFIMVLIVVLEPSICEANEVRCSAAQ